VGSGFIVDADGYIMTNAHVVSGAQRVQVILPADDADGTLATALSGRMNVVAARIVGIASELDLAVLKIDDKKLPALPLASYSQLRQGETVFAFGSPVGLRNSLTHGLVSAVA
jgi:serine protease Do